MELGFISTPDEEEFLNSNEAVDLYSRGFYNAFVRYKNKYDSHLAVPYKVEKVDKVEMPQVVPEKYKKPVAPVKKSEVEVRPTTQPSKKTADVSAPVFKIQILAASRQLSKGDAHFQGEDNFEVYQEGGLYKYTLGSSTDYNAIYRLRKTLLGKFPESFIIAFKDGKKCNVNDAIREFKANRNK
jgi:N-acetylmuramoyl-L-alanine amidase